MNSSTKVTDDKKASDNDYRIIITPETHWDREWYLPFQEYRAKLVLMMDQLLEILEKNPEYKNFTLDGQTVPIEDYLEVRPEKTEIVKRFVKEGRLSIGPMYVLPDEYLVSGESMIRNLMLGHKISNQFGKVMKAGYIPDPFGHFAQLPQILAGFNVPSMLFSRGFGDEFEKLNLNMEFNWEAPGNAACVIGVHLIRGYGSVAGLSTVKNRDGIYKSAIDRIKSVVRDLKEKAATNAIILNNGTDHKFAQPHIPEIVSQLNNGLGSDMGVFEQADFERYVSLVKKDINEKNIKLKTYSGELHGGRYQFLLSGVYSARMWIKQWNHKCQALLERYTEPFSTISSSMGAGQYPHNYIWTAWRWLLKNHPHDSICGCSIDYVHDMDMQTRFGWAEQIGNEIIKNQLIQFTKKVKFDTKEGEQFPIFIFNPLPRKQSALIRVPIILDENLITMIGKENWVILDDKGNEVYSFIIDDVVDERYTRVGETAVSVNFIAQNIPSMGIKTFYFMPGEEPELTESDIPNEIIVKCGEEKGLPYLENTFYKVSVDKDGTFSLFDKELGIEFKQLGIVEDVGDWGDEYDFSGPKKDQIDRKILSTEPDQRKSISVKCHGNAGSISVQYALELPVALTEDRKSRTEETVQNFLGVSASLVGGKRAVYFDIVNDNNSMDHRLRILFPSGITTDYADADGHFYVNHRPIDLPSVDNWAQNPVPTHHQKKFVSVNDEEKVVVVMNEGLPEYEIVRNSADLSSVNPDGSAIVAVTLLRSVGWLSRGDFATRNGNAGPALSTPGAQCLGFNEFSLALTTGKGNWFEAKIHHFADEFVHEPLVMNPFNVQASSRTMDMFSLSELNIQTSNVKPGNEIDPEFSFLELEGDSFLLSALKWIDNDKSKSLGSNEKSFIVRVTNYSDQISSGILRFTEKISIKSAEIVNLYEEKPSDEFPVKGIINSFDASANKIEFKAEPHVILTIKVNL